VFHVSSRPQGAEENKNVHNNNNNNSNNNNLIYIALACRMTSEALEGVRSSGEGVRGRWKGLGLGLNQ